MKVRVRIEGTVPERFMAKVNKTQGCWEWTGAVGSSRYGNFWDGSRFFTAHRWSYTHFVGDPGNLMVLHKCDNRRCVNPEHLFLGTAKDNSQDMVAKGRDPRGERQGCAKLSVAKVHAIRQDPRPRDVIAAEYGVSGRQVSRVKQRINWKHVA